MTYIPPVPLLSRLPLRVLQGQIIDCEMAQCSYAAHFPIHPLFAHTVEDINELDLLFASRSMAFLRPCLALVAQRRSAEYLDLGPVRFDLANCPEPFLAGLSDSYLRETAPGRNLHPPDQLRTGIMRKEHCAGTFASESIADERIPVP